MAVLRFLRNTLVGGGLMFLLALGLDAAGRWILAPAHARGVPPGVGEAFRYLAHIFRMPAEAITTHHAAHATQIGTTVLGFAFWGVIIAAMARAHEAKADLRRKREAIEARR